MKILLVDDEQSIIEIFSQVLQKANYTVVTAMTGKDALDKVQMEHPDVILLDQILPDLNGNEVLKSIKAQDATKNIPVALLSNYSDDKMMKDAIAAGASDYILKYQIEPTDLIQKVQQIVLEQQPVSQAAPTK